MIVENREASLPSFPSSFDLNRGSYRGLQLYKSLNMEIYRMENIIQGKEGIKETLITLILEGIELLLQIWNVLQLWNYLH